MVLNEQSVKNWVGHAGMRSGKSTTFGARCLKCPIKAMISGCLVYHFAIYHIPIGCHNVILLSSFAEGVPMC